ncbi:hypothetical protein I3760_07G075300 [Carya illinoinensis]|nr:hypothetical protein I3760_07G075300 [Carya illinoinensis]
MHAADCSLFNSTDPLYPVPNYKEYPKCRSGIHEKVDNWNNFPKTLCCRNRLDIWSQYMALYARRTQANNLLASEDLLETCFHPIPSINPKLSLNISCGIENIFYGSSQYCSKLSLSTVKEEESYGITLEKCSFVSDTFEEASCANCTSPILDLGETLLTRSEVEDKKNNTERSICAVAAVISVAAGQSDEVDGWAMIDNFYRCLPALDHARCTLVFFFYSTELADNHDDHFIKIRYTALLAILIAIGILVPVLIIVPLKPAKSQVNMAWSGLYRFSKAEIGNAMDNFDDHRKVGQVVAIKHINKSNEVDSFRREVEGLSRIRHQNLVSLVGFCVEDGEQYLVYEFCPAGNLAQHLLRKDASVLTWEIRVKILRDCALALSYLHHYIDGCIVHRDIKTKVFTDVRGTIGYMDPEYMSNAQWAKDVNIGNRPVSDFEDPTPKRNFNRVDFQSILQVAVLRVSKTSIGRPNIGVFEEVDRIWKSTVDYKKAKQGMSSS